MPRVSQKFIDLLNVPLPQLKRAAEQLEVTGFKSMGKWALADRLAQESRDALESLMGDFMYAGKTSLSFFRLDTPRRPTNGPAGEPAAAADGGDGDEHGPLSGEPLDEDDVIDVLNEMSPGGDAFDEARRPAQVTREPQLVVARDRGDRGVFATFAIEKSVAQVIHDFTPTEVYADDFFNAVVHADTGLVEVRAGQQVVQRFARRWLDDFAGRFELEPYLVSITLDDFQALKGELDAGMVRYRGKVPSGGSMDTIEITASPDFVDLTGEVDFEDKASGTDQLMGYLKFKYDDKDWTIRVSQLFGSIYFVTPATEDVIAHVRETLREVKTRHLTGS